MRLRTLAPFDIGFDCKPQRFVKDGENAVVFTKSGSIFNQYGQIALPRITIYGQGSGWLTVGKVTISIYSIDGTLYLDSETQNAYNNNGNQNMNIKAPVFPVLEDGESVIGWGGDIERIEIIPRWWEI
jgi:phage-related protein